jgi:hypothetical protein
MLNGTYVLTYKLNFLKRLKRLSVNRVYYLINVLNNIFKHLKRIDVPNMLYIVSYFI